MSLPRQGPFSRVTERKSRRTHKNSRDGCPNCKAKRIKCTEELPSCHNCIKKNYRCGYMDFPEEKLGKIKKKNEKKTGEHKYLKGVPDSTFEPSTPQNPQILHHTSSANSVSNSSVSEIVPSLPTSFSPPTQQPRSQQQQQIQHLPYHQGAPEQNQYNNEEGRFKKDFYNSKDSLRMSLFQDTIFKLSKGDTSFSVPNEQEDSIFKIFPTTCETDRPDMKHSSGINIESEDGFQQSTGAQALYLDDIGSNEILLNQGTSGSYPMPVAFEWRKSPGRSLGTFNAFGNINEVNTSNASARNLNPLPNAINKCATFPKLQHAKRLRNTYLERYLQNCEKDVKSLVNLEYQPIFSPVWTNTNSDSFWASVYNQSVVLEVYFSFFMDRSLNVLLRTCNVTLNGEVFSNLSDSPLASSMTPSNTSISSNTSSNDRFFFTKRDLDILTQKSYKYYGALIKDLRKSISDIHIEYPLKISLFAAWSTFFHLHSTVDTLCLMYNGTSTLLMQVFNNANSIEEITPTISVTLEVLNGHALAAVIPDYNFDIIFEIYDDFIVFKKFFMDVQDNYNKKLANVNSRDWKRKRLTSSLEKHDCLKLEKFLHNLTTVIFPKLKYINHYYRSNRNIKDSNSTNVYFISVRLIFDLLVSWFGIFPSEALSMGSKANPVKKTFYLFFSVIGRALVNVLSPVRSVLLVDPCHLFCPRVDFDPEIYKVEQEDISAEEYHYLRALSEKMLRIVSFFDYRMLFYSYYLSTTTVLNGEYLKPLDVSIPRGDDNYNDDCNDILQLFAKKLDTHEHPVDNFKNTTFNANHFPIFDIFHNNNEYSSTLNEEQRDQRRRLQQLPNEFDYRSGLFTHDFNPLALFRILEKNQRSTWTRCQPTLEEMRIRVQNFDYGRRAVANTVRNNHQQT